MSTAFAVLNKSKNTLTDFEQAILAEAALDAGAYDPIPTRVKISPGGTNVFQTSDGEVLKELTCIVVISQKARAYWPTKDVASGLPPFCTSHDGVHGLLALELPKTQIDAAMTAPRPHLAIPILSQIDGVLPNRFDCAVCPLSQYGSAHQNGSGKSQACKSLRRLVIHVDGWASPALLTLPPTSIAVFDAYASGLARLKSAYFAVRTKVELERKTSGGNAYSVAKFSRVESLSEGEFAAVLEVRNQFASLVRDLPVVIDDYDTRPAAGESGEIPL